MVAVLVCGPGLLLSPSTLFVMCEQRMGFKALSAALCRCTHVTVRFSILLVWNYRPTLLEVALGR